MALTTDASRLKKIHGLLDENSAKRANLTAVKINGGSQLGLRETRILTRYWSKISDGDRVDAEEFLLAKTSVFNKDEANTVYVVNPKMDRETLDGRWRLLRVFSGKIKTNPEDQGVFQTLIYWPEDYGDFASYCAESSPLRHEDVTLSFYAAQPCDVAHASTRGHNYGAQNTFDPETGSWNCRLSDEKARPYPFEIDGTTKTIDDAIARYERGLGYYRCELLAANQLAHPFPTQAALDAWRAANPNVLLDGSADLNRLALLDWNMAKTHPILYPAAGSVFPVGAEAHSAAPTNLYMISDTETETVWRAYFLNVSETFYDQMAAVLVTPGPVAASNGAVIWSLQPELNRFELLDVTLTKRLVKSPLGALSNEMRWRIPGQTRMITQSWAVDPDTGETLAAFIQRQDIELHYAKVIFGMAAAYQYIHQTDSEGSQPNHAGSSVQKIGDNLFFAHKVVSTYDDSTLDAAFAANFPA